MRLDPGGLLRLEVRRTAPAPVGALPRAADRLVSRSLTVVAVVFLGLGARSFAKIQV